MRIDCHGDNDDDMIMTIFVVVSGGVPSEIAALAAQSFAANRWGNMLVGMMTPPQTTISFEKMKADVVSFVLFG